MTDRQIYEACLKLKPHERSAYLDNACGADKALRQRVEHLLNLQNSSPGLLEKPTVDESQPDTGTQAYVPSASLDVSPGTTIAGRYKIIQELGEGGMGTVYVAEQREPVKRLVALKLIKTGMNSKVVLTRFEAERQALALMGHPNIAKMLDGGVTDQNQPYFVMELVKGVPINKFCDQEHLTPKERLELFIPVCQAVQHAHQKGIIHRDLKPSNILVGLYDGKPVAKVIDFGVAKAVHHKLTERTMYTEVGSIIGTLEYMAPEQAELNNLDIDTRADIYALGVILYELLTGSTPFSSKQLRGAAFDEMLRMIREEEPAKPSTKISSSEKLQDIAAKRKLEPKRLTALVAGELDWIVMKCLEKDRGRRYETANGLAGDMQLYLSGEPVLAYPPSLWYRMRKFVQRNKAKVVAAALILFVFIAGMIGTLWGLLEAKHQESQARISQYRETEQRIRADIKASEANHEKVRADHLAQKAINERNVAQQALSLQANREGFRLIDKGEYLDGILWLTQPILVANNQPEIVETTRQRLLAYRQQEGDRLTCQLILTHEGKVNSARFSPDGLRIVTTSTDKTARVWDSKTGNLIFPPFVHNEEVNNAAFSPDGNYIVTASSDKTARLIHADTGETRTLLHEKTVVDAEFSPDGHRIVTVSVDNVARIWDVASGKSELPTLSHSKEVKHASFSPDGSLILTASVDHTAQIWNASSGRSLNLKLQHKAPVFIARFSPDGRRIVTGSFENSARTWDATTGQPISPPLTHQTTVSGMGMVHIARFSPDGQHVVSAGTDHTARLWNATTGQAIAQPLIHQGLISHLEYSPDGRFIITASHDSTARVWDAATGKPLTQSIRHQSSVKYASFSPDGRRIVTASDDSTIRIWEMSTFQHDTPSLNHEGAVLSASFSPDSRRIVTASYDKTARIWDANTGKLLLPPLKHNDTIRCASFSPDGLRIVTASFDKTARIWDATTGQPITSPLSHIALVNDAAFSSDNSHIVTASGNTARVWNANTGKPVSPLLVHHVDKGSLASIVQASFSPDGRNVLTASVDRTARIWNAITGNPQISPLVHERPLLKAMYSPSGKHVLTVSLLSPPCLWDASNGKPLDTSFPNQPNQNATLAKYSLDGRRLVTVSLDKAVRVWDTMTWQPISPPLLHNGAVQDASFSPDGSKVVTASHDNTSRVWDANTGQPITPPLRHHGSVSRASFSSDGQLIVTASEDKTSKIWSLKTDKRPSNDLIRLAQIQSGNKIDNTGGLQPIDVNKELLPYYTELKLRYPEEFSPAYNDVYRWRMKQIDECCKTRSISAAMYHNKWLITELGGDNTTANTIKLTSKLPQYIDIQKKLASLCLANGKLPEAIRLLTLLREHQTIKLGYDHSETQSTNIMLVEAYMKDGKHLDAIMLYVQLIGIRIRKLGDVLPDFLNDITYNLAIGYHNFGKLDLALPLFEETLKHRKVKFGIDHPECVTIMQKLGTVYHQLGKHDQAVQVSNQIYETRKSLNGDDSPETLSSLNDLAIATENAGKFDLAVSLYQDAIKGYKAANLPGTEIVIHNLGMAYSKAGKHDQALAPLEECFKLRKAKLGVNHTDTISSMNNLALAYQDARKLDQAILLFEEALKLKKAKLGDVHSETLHSLLNLASAYQEGGRPDRVIFLCNESLGKLREHLSKDGLELASILATFGKALIETKDFIKAEMLLRECLTIRKNKQPDNYRTFNAMSLLGAALLGQKKYVEAEPLLLAGCEGVRQRQKTVPLRFVKKSLAELYVRLIQLYTETNNLQEAARWRKELEAHQKKYPPPAPEKKR